MITIRMFSRAALFAFAIAQIAVAVGLVAVAAASGGSPIDIPAAERTHHHLNFI